MNHEVVSPAEWEKARIALLVKEKELTRALDALSQQRRELPWERVQKKYVFDGPEGEETLSDLFAGRSQLIVYHFMFAPEWEAGCKACSFWADNFERNVVHLASRDATLIAISRAPYEKLQAFKKRFGWTFKWVSSGRTDFNYDFRVSFREGQANPIYNFAPNTIARSDLPGISVFYRAEDGSIFRTYSTYGRGVEAVNAGYHFMDLLPKGRDEHPVGPSSWLRFRDEYDVPA